LNVTSMPYFNTVASTIKNVGSSNFKDGFNTLTA
jgi:hypothetical protein